MLITLLAIIALLLAVAIVPEFVGSAIALVLLVCLAAGAWWLFSSYFAVIVIGGAILLFVAGLICAEKERRAKGLDPAIRTVRKCLVRILCVFTLATTAAVWGVRHVPHNKIGWQWDTILLLCSLCGLVAIIATCFGLILPEKIVKWFNNPNDGA